MPTLRVTCPHCSFNREIPSDTLPEQPVQATCPHCHKSFRFSKAETLAAADTAAQTETAALPPLRPEPPPAPPAPPVPPTPTDSPLPGANNNRNPAARELLSVGELFSSTWELFKQRCLLLIGIFIATAVAAAAPPLLVGLLMSGMGKGSFSNMVLLFMLLGLAVIVSFIVICWGMAAAVGAAVDERLGFREAFEKAKGYWLAMAWISALYSFIVGGATLLLLIPGILTGIWFFACAYLVVDDDTRGMDALLQSKALVAGRFWPVLGRLLLVWLMGTVVGMIPVIGAIMSLLVAPFSLLYSVVLYRNLRDTAGSVSWPAGDGTKAAWLLLGLAGYVLVPLLLFILLGAAFFAGLEPLFRTLVEQGATQQIRIGTGL